MIQTTKQILVNDKVVVKISGENRKEVLGEFWKYINYGNAVKIRKGTEIEDDTGLSWLDITETSGYFRTNIPDLIKTMVTIELFKILREFPELDEIPGQVTEEAQKRGIERFHQLPEENILGNDVDIE